jgi:hypothetical protein
LPRGKPTDLLGEGASSNIAGCASEAEKVTGRAVAFASVLSAVLVAGAIGVTIWSFEVALRERDRALLLDHG